MDCQTSVFRALSLLGRPLRGKISFRFLLFVFILALNLFQSFLGFKSRWKVLKFRFQSIEDIAVEIFVFALTLQLGWASNKLIFMIDLINRNCNHSQLPEIEKQEKVIINYYKKKEISTVSVFILITNMYTVVNGLLPYFLGVYFAMTTDLTSLSSEEIPMLIECWLPISVNGPLSYAILVFPQLMFFITTRSVCYVWFTIIICSLLHLEKEIDLLCLLIKNIDGLSKLDYLDQDLQNENRLRNVFRNIVLYHEMINRIGKDLNHVQAFIILLINYVCFAQMCIILYGFFEIEDITVKAKYITLLFPVYAVLIYFSWYGQQVLNKCENLEFAVSEISWINKPKWFKKNLLIIMLRVKKPIEIKPYTLYVLNYNNLLMVSRAAYSFFNIMRTMHSKQNY